MSEGKHDVRTHASKEEPVKKKKKKRGGLRIVLALIVLLVAAVAGSTAYMYKTTLDSLDVSFKEEDMNVEFGAKLPAMDCVAESTGDTAPEAATLDTDSVGAKALNFTVSKPILGGLLTPTKEFTLSYNVVDTEPPLILWNGSGSVLERGTGFDINRVMAYGDNADPAPQVKVDGEVDMDTVGSYDLHVTITDASGNSTDKDMTINVADTLPVYEDDSPRTPFADFVSTYKGDGRKFGIDVSAWQDDVDFEAVKAAGCEFVIIRIGYSEDGSMTIDKRFDNNFQRAKAAGLKVGVYVFSYENNQEDVRAVADQVVEKLGGEELDLPIAFDWEDFGSFQSYGMSFADLNGLYDAFADELAGSGYSCMLYGNRNALEKIWDDTDIRPVWLAHYTDKTDYDEPYILWQASCTGRIDGIDGDVDMDILYEN